MPRSQIKHSYSLNTPSACDNLCSRSDQFHFHLCLCPAAGPRNTREVKLGCVFTQTTTDAEGRPIRDTASTTYTGAIETAELFGRRLYVEAFERGWDRAKKKVVLGDGAEWIWNISDQHFAGAVQIVDIWHAREHLCDVA